MTISKVGICLSHIGSAVADTIKDNCVELRSPKRYEILPGASVSITANSSVYIPGGVIGEIKPRKRHALDQKIRIGAELLHENFNGRPIINIVNDGDTLFEIGEGDTIAQLVFVLTAIIEVHDVPF